MIKETRRESESTPLIFFDFSVCEHYSVSWLSLECSKKPKTLNLTEQFNAQENGKFQILESMEDSGARLLKLWNCWNVLGQYNFSYVLYGRI